MKLCGIFQNVSRIPSEFIQIYLLSLFLYFKLNTQGVRMKKKTLTIVGIIAALLIVGFGGYWYLQSRSTDDTGESVEIVEIYNGYLEASVQAIGKVRSGQTARLVWKNSGIVESVMVTAGTDVSAGDLLANLTQTSLPQSVILAQADLVVAQKNLEDLLNSADSSAIADAQLMLAMKEENLKDAQEDWDTITFVGTSGQIADAGETLEEALKDYNKAKDELDEISNKNSREYMIQEIETNQLYDEYVDALYTYNYYTGHTVDDYEKAVYAADLAVAEQELIEAQELLDDLLNGVDEDEIRAAEARVAAVEASLKTALIDAPFDGTITEVNVISGDIVNVNESAFSINNLDILLIDLDVSEIDINQIDLEQEAVITFDAIPLTEYVGTVVEVSMDGIESNGLVDFPVVVQITNPDEQIRLGMTASVEIIVEKQEEALLIPNQAIRVDEGVQVVYQLDGDNNFVSVPVVLGYSSDTFSEVLSSSLQEGDLVVINPSVLLNQTEDMFARAREVRNETLSEGPGVFFGGGD
jgi:HlyD family secretion protein